MLRLDETKPYGKVSPPWSGDSDEFDRPVFYEQDGHLFDQYKREVIPGRPLALEPPPVREPDRTVDGKLAPADAEAIRSPTELLRRVNELPWPTFRKLARQILGETCPASKPAIIAELEKAISEYNQRLSRRQSRPPPASAPAPAKQPDFQGMSWDGQRPEPTSKSVPAPTPVPPKGAPTAPDLAAWARGQREYLFAEVQKAIRSQYHIMVTERHDAVNLLVDEGVVPAHQARRDV